VITITSTIISDKNPIPTNEPGSPTVSYDISFQVLNGCGKSGLALAVRSELVNMGFDVLSIDNAKKFIYQRTILLIRKMDPEKLEIVKKQLNISNIYMQLKEDSLYDFVLILGADYGRYFKDID
jgi:hypothetical protein